MASSDNASAVFKSSLATSNLQTRVKRRKKRFWTSSSLKKRDGCYVQNNLLSELKFSREDFRNYLRMNEETYLNLLSLVTPLIKRKDTLMRLAISPHERLSATLMFLATGRDFEYLKLSTLISSQALGSIIPETCEAIYKVLRKDHFKFPQTEEEWENVAALFEAKWNLPHCLGAMGGKHIRITPPGNNGRVFYNYKGSHSMVLLAIVDARHRFLMCDFGTNGRESNETVLENTRFFEKLQNNQLNIPKEGNIKNSITRTPYVFVVDDAFPLREDMMKPFSREDLISEERSIFDYRLSRVRRIVENTFGILASRFGIFHKAIKLQPHKIESIIMASCVLHNFLINSVPSSYTPPHCFDRENTDDGTVALGYDTKDSLMLSLDQNDPGCTELPAQKVREDFMNYFVNEGQLPWQKRFISN